MKAFPAPVVTFAVMAVLLTACGAVPGRTAASSLTPGGAASGSPTPGASVGVFGRVFDNPDVTVTGGRLYVTWQVNAASAAVPRFELARVNQASGVIEATRRLPAGYLGAPLAAGGWLWVTTTTPDSERLLRMNPADLDVTGDIGIGDRPFAWDGGDGIAAASGVLWVTSGSRLLRVSPRTDKVMAVIPLPGAYSSGVGASADGTVLVVAEANDGGLGSVQRRDPLTGALIAAHPMVGVTAPRIGGVVGSGVWVAEPTGLQGYAERFAVATMAPDPATDVGGTNGIDVRVGHGSVWVTDYVGGARRNYCASPVTGHRLATIPLPDLDQDRLLAVSDRYLYYDAPASGGFYLKRVPVPSAC